MIESNSTQLQNALDRLSSYVANSANLLNVIGAYQKQRFSDTFVKDQDPTGQNWIPLAASTLQRKQSQKILVESAGRIPGSLFYSVSGDVLTVGYSHPLAIFHHYGAGARNQVPQSQRSLFTAGGTKPIRGKGRRLPARPLIGYTDTDMQQWEEFFEEGIKDAWEAT